MTLTILFFSLFATIFTIPLAASPLTLGLWILFTALIIATTTSFFLSSWFSFIIFIIYIGGLLVMFAYFVAIDPNNKLELLQMFSTAFITVSLFTFLLSKSNFITMSNLQKMSTKSFTSLYSLNNFLILLTLAMLLFLALIMVVKISQRKEGALRPFITFYV